MSKILVILDTKYQPISISKNWSQEFWNRLPEHLFGWFGWFALIFGWFGWFGWFLAGFEF